MEIIDTSSVAVARIDINSVDALEKKCLASFINHFITSTVSFLNTFSRNCEEKLERMHYRIEAINTQLTVLECKLESSQTLS